MVSQVKNLGGSIVGPPLLTTWGPKRVEIFHIGTQLGLHHKWRNGVYPTSFQPGGTSWERLSETGHLSITGVCWGEKDHVDLFGVRAQGNTLDHKWYKGEDGGWRNWESLNPTGPSGSDSIKTRVAGDISAITWGEDTPNIVAFWRGIDSALHYMTWDNDVGDKRWFQLTWTKPGMVFVGSPKAICWEWGGDHRVEVFARDANNHLLHTGWNTTDAGPMGAASGHYLTWDDLGGPIVDDPEVVHCTSYDDNKNPMYHINVFARDPENNIMRKRWLPGVGIWLPRDRFEATGLQAATPPGAAAWSSNNVGNIAVAALGMDNRLHFAKQDGFKPWETTSWTVVEGVDDAVPFTHRPVVYHPRGDAQTWNDPVEIYVRAADTSMKQISVEN